MTREWWARVASHYTHTQTHTHTLHIHYRYCSFKNSKPACFFIKNTHTKNRKQNRNIAWQFAFLNKHKIKYKLNVVTCLFNKHKIKYKYIVVTCLFNKHKIKYKLIVVTCLFNKHKIKYKFFVL